MVDISHIKNIAIIGAGVQGHSVAQTALMAGFEKVILNDISIELIEKAANQIENDPSYGLRILEAKGQLSKGLTADTLMENLYKEVDLAKTASKADFIIECAPEIMNIKQDVFRALGKYAPEHTILATNTSSMSITEIGKFSGRLEKVVGMHFFPPVAIQCCVEVMKGEKTSDEVLDMCVTIGKKLPCIKRKRLSIRIEKESPGFIANRLLIPTTIYTNWIFDKAYEMNIPWEQIDADAGAGRLVSMGPCQLTDYLGVDALYNVMKSFQKFISPDFAPSKIITKLMKEGNLGKKTGKGFYDWTKGQPKLNLSKKAGLFNQEIVLAIQLNEGCKLLEEGIVSGYKIIDDVMITGTSMPGPFSAGKRNYVKWSKILEEIAEKMGKNYIKPCELMKSGEFLKMRK